VTEAALGPKSLARVQFPAAAVARPGPGVWPRRSASRAPRARAGTQPGGGPLTGSPDSLRLVPKASLSKS
jgi:hypothetical protein